MDVLIACEWSGVVRDAFRARGHDAISCDLLPSATPGPHYQGDVRDLLRGPWDLVVAFPPCTYLAVSGARWWSGRLREQAEAVELVRDIYAAGSPSVAIENPIGHLSTAWGKPDQIIQPWQYGHGETKATCLWLRGLPLLTPTSIVAGREHRVHRMPPGPDRSRLRGRTYDGIAAAMAEQWG